VGGYSESSGGVTVPTTGSGELDVCLGKERSSCSSSRPSEVGGVVCDCRRLLINSFSGQTQIITIKQDLLAFGCRSDTNTAAFFPLVLS